MMDLWFSTVLFTASQFILSWYCAQLAKEKGYTPTWFAIFGLLPVLNLFSLMMLLLLPDKKLQEHQLYFSKYRQRP
jgi:hypothetical protein